MVAAALAMSSTNTTSMLPSTHEWADMVTASVYEPTSSTSAGSNLLLHMASTATSVPPISTNRLLVLEEIHSIQCAISTTHIAIKLRQAQLCSLKTRLAACLDSLQAPRSAIHANKENKDHSTYPHYLGFAHDDGFPTTNALILPTPPTLCNSITSTKIHLTTKESQY
jgi:hypothetical protein